MATRYFSRSLLTKVSFSSPSLSLSSTTTAPRLSLLHLRSISTAVTFTGLRRLAPTTAGLRSFSTRQNSTSLSDPQPNWSNRPPKETILLDGCDFEHWLVVVDKPDENATRDEIVDLYVKTLANVVGSEEEAKMKLYSVSTRCYFAFGALVTEEVSYKLKELPNVRWVLPDSYLDVKNKDYGGEPVINGLAVPYDPKYHEEWIRNNARAGERNRRNDRPRNSDRSRNFERRRENMQSRDFQNEGPRDAPPNMAGPQNPPSNMGGPPPQNMGRMPPNNMGGGMPPNNMGGGMPPNNMGGGMPPNNMGGGMPPNNMGGGMPPNNMGGGMPPNNMGGGMPTNNMGRGMPPNNMGGIPQNNMGGGMPRMPQNNMGPNNMGGVPQNNMGGTSPNYNPNMGGLAPPNNMRGPAPSFQNNEGMASPGQGPNREYQNNNNYEQNMGGMPMGGRDNYQNPGNNRY